MPTTKEAKEIKNKAQTPVETKERSFYFPSGNNGAGLSIKAESYEAAQEKLEAQSNSTTA